MSLPGTMMIRLMYKVIAAQQCISLLVPNSVDLWSAWEPLLCKLRTLWSLTD